MHFLLCPSVRSRRFKQEYRRTFQDASQNVPKSIMKKSGSILDNDANYGCMGEKDHASSSLEKDMGVVVEAEDDMETTDIEQPARVGVFETARIASKMRARPRSRSCPRGLLKTRCESTKEREIQSHKTTNFFSYSCMLFDFALEILSDRKNMLKLRCYKQL
ncbi:hypothetical protein AB6A40_011397 [Gnathostoma spinigerum]|uniref:Uncharacterized protein n=1 Tax=Gnathostoma spinigerum TaxID=75299 RepID=A0ABD6F3G2_9BILA